MKNDIFYETRRLVTARHAAEYYGFQANRAGFIPCPFHSEKTASLKLYDNGSWYCFGCQQHGSSIDFTAKLFDLSPLEAVRKMNMDFNLALPLDKPPSKSQMKAAKERHKLQEISSTYEKWRDDFINLLNSAYREGHLILVNWPDELAEREVLAVKWHDILEYWSDILTFGSMDEQITIFRDRKGIEQLCRRILKNMRQNLVA